MKRARARRGRTAARRLALLAAALLACGPALAAGGATPAADGAMPGFHRLDRPYEIADVSFLDARGDSVRLSSFRGRVVLLDLWATWCPPCVAEMPALDRLQQRLGGPDFAVVAVSLDEGGMSTVLPFLHRHHIDHLRAYADPQQNIGWALPVDVVPATFILDRGGRILGYLRSYTDWDAPEASAMIRSLIARRRASR